MFILKKRFVWPLILLVCLLLYYFTPISSVLGRARDPIYTGGSLFYAAGQLARRGWEGLTGGFRLQRELASQEEAMAALAKTNTDLYFLQEENSQLRALLDLKNQAPERPFIPASVLTLDRALRRSLLVIDRGGADGVKVKWPVVSGSGVLVGKILSTSAHTSVVLLTTDRESAVAATLAKDANMQAIVKGKIGLSLSLELVPQAAALSAGDIIVTSSLEENTPLGLPIARVAAVFYKEGELFKRANLEPLLSFDNLKVVAVWPAGE
ncbi:MAG: rod shape-determining protein MreC [Candidatus Komeilibacteria bacterium]|nr:rod shape-determining protein MreC [Candidatus Komeilibacteria bacterium]